MPSIRRFASALLALVPAVCWAGAAKPHRTPQYVYAAPQVSAAASSVIASTVYPGPGSARLVNVIAYQLSAGSGGTSWSVNVRDASNATLLATNATIPITASTNAVTNATGTLTCTGCTAPVIKAGAVVAEGGYVDIQVTEAGTYTGHPSIRVVLVFEPL